MVTTRSSSRTKVVEATASPSARIKTEGNKTRGRPRKNQNKLEKSLEKKFPDDFPSLKESFGSDAKVPLIGLLFAAGWCPDCQPVVPKIAALLREGEGAKETLQVFYVASDNTAKEMTEFLSSCGASDLFQTISFPDSERNNLKIHFQTCAKKEMADVGLGERKSGIPTWKLFRASNASILLEDAVPDVVELSPLEALNKWKKLVSDASEEKV